MKYQTALVVVVVSLVAVTGAATAATPIGSGVESAATSLTGPSDAPLDATASALDDHEESENATDDGACGGNVTITQSAAREIADGALSPPANASWVLTESSLHEADGYYEFEYALEGAGVTDGEAEVRVDGSNGSVIRLEQEIGDEEEGEEDEDEDEDENEDEDEDENENENEDEDEDENENEDESQGQED